MEKIASSHWVRILQVACSSLSIPIAEKMSALFLPGEQPLPKGTIMKDEYDFSQGKQGAVIPSLPNKTRITIRLDTDVVNWFRGQDETIVFT